MKMIIKGRSEGKTTELIRMADGEDIYIVCADSNRVEQLYAMAQSMECKIRFPLTFNEFLNYSGYQMKFAFDDVDDILQSLTPYQIIAITLTKDEKENKLGTNGLAQAVEIPNYVPPNTSSF